MLINGLGMELVDPLTTALTGHARPATPRARHTPPTREIASSRRILRIPAEGTARVRPAGATPPAQAKPAPKVPLPNGLGGPTSPPPRRRAASRRPARRVLACAAVPTVRGRYPR